MINELIETYKLLQQELNLTKENNEKIEDDDNYITVVTERLPIIDGHLAVFLEQEVQGYDFNEEMSDESLFLDILGQWTDLRVELRESVSKKGIGDPLEKAIQFFERSYKQVLAYEKGSFDLKQKLVEDVVSEIRLVVSDYLNLLSGLDEKIAVVDNFLEMDTYESDNEFLQGEEAIRFLNDMYRKENCKLVFYDDYLVAEVDIDGKVRFPMKMKEGIFEKKIKELRICYSTFNYYSNITELDQVIKALL